ncbi:hypothetical protein [Mycobacterium simiae]|uniref:hypothetical protein n=1 Tax=Mycobacterium simiae TaxID=1784 RepID=UPI000425C0E7|nr:hypothetical protein X011_23400 [Mycobacterium tuberculosis variant microti OV254]BBX40002.1 hypothetical protein MSIM_14530 [Mycobacterium simiae]
MRSVLVGLLVLFCSVCPASSNADPCHPAELFVADNTDPLFELQADATIVRTGVAVTGSTPLDGVYWSGALQRLDFERSREFHLCSTDASALHRAGEALRSQFDQQSVLSFDYQGPDSNAVLITVPDVDIARLGDALTADPTARTRLRGGSVTATDHTLILVAKRGDRELARALISAAGGNWDAAEILDGTSEFVE